LALAPALMIVLPALHEGSLSLAVSRALRGEDNPLYRSFLSQSSRLVGIATAAVAGPPQGMVLLPGFHGMRGMITALSSASRTEGLLSLAGLLLGWAVVGGSVLRAVRRRDLAWLLGLAALLLLPVVARTSQYTYLKFYVLYPALLAMSLADAAPRPVMVAALGLFLFNVGQAAQDVVQGRVLVSEHRAIFAAAPLGSCGLSEAWSMSLGPSWKSQQCGLLGLLANGSGSDVDVLLETQYVALHDCLINCFCHAPVVYTESMVTSARPETEAMLAHFHYPWTMPDAIWFDLKQAKPLTAHASSPLYRYSPEVQAAVCAELRSSPRH
jgi:hypothetical protein